MTINKNIWVLYFIRKYATLYPYFLKAMKKKSKIISMPRELMVGVN